VLEQGSYATAFDRKARSSYPLGVPISIPQWGHRTSRKMLGFQNQSLVWNNSWQRGQLNNHRLTVAPTPVKTIAMRRMPIATEKGAAECCPPRDARTAVGLLQAR
jgi:hypothetical protein